MERFIRLCGVALMLGSPALFAGDLKRDETIVYFPTNGSWSEQSGAWQVPLHGWIFETEEDSLWRRGAMAMLRDQLGLPPDGNDAQHLKERGWPFLVDNERGKQMTIELADRPFRMGKSGANGHFFGEASLTDTIDDAAAPTKWVHFATVMPSGDERRFGGMVQLIAPGGLSVLSDIDDTIKRSDVLDKEALLANTFLRDFQAVPGMAERYRQWAEQGAAFHYVTGSPWQLYPALKGFLEDEGFPSGSFAMRHFRLKDGSLLDFLSSSKSYKVETIAALMQRYPARRFILIGDSGENDPEVYGEIARRYPMQVSAIHIRNVTGETRESARMSAAFSSLAPERWQLFEDGHDMARLPHNGSSRAEKH